MVLIVVPFLILFIFNYRTINGNIEYDFKNLDSFLDHLMNIKLFPVIEFMVLNNITRSRKFSWSNFVEQFLDKYNGKTV